MQVSDFQERKNKRLAVVFFAMAIVLTFVIWLTRRESHTEIDKNIFKVENTESIDRIEMEKANGKIQLRFDGTNWRVNDDKKADPNLVKVVMATLRQVEVKRQVGEKVADSLDTALKKNGVKVSVFAHDQLLKRFIAGGNEQKTQAFFKPDGDKNIYLTAIPGYRVYVSGIFDLDESGWREKRVFGFNWRNFQSLEVRYPENAANSFTVSPQNGVFGVQGIPTDTVKLGTFMENILSLQVDAYRNDKSLFDSLNQVKPTTEFLVYDVAKNTYSLKVYPPGSSAEAPAILNNKELVSINTQRLRSIIRPKSWFLKR